MKPFQLRMLLCTALLLGLIQARADRVDDYIRGEMTARQIPGLALNVTRKGKPVKTAGYGLANLELQVPVRPNTVFEIGSVTKQLTAAGILLLQQEGKVSVDQRVASYIPGTPSTWSNVTVRHLLTHTSGIKSYTGLEGFEIRRHLNQQQFVAAIGGYPLEFEPGAAWNYSNTGYNLLGYIIENVSSRTYWDFMSERIFKPLGMTCTTNRLPGLIIPNRADGYEQTNHLLINRDYDLTEVFAAGAIASTVLDLAKWNAALDGDRLLNRESKRQMWTPALLNSGVLTNYGFGWRIERLEGKANMGHGGSTSGFSASIQRFPEQQLAVIVLTNTDEQIATRLARRIARFYF